MTILELAFNTLVLTTGNTMSVLMSRRLNIKQALSKYKQSIKTLVKEKAYLHQESLDKISHFGGKLAISSIIAVCPLLIANYFAITYSAHHIDYLIALIVSSIIVIAWLLQA